MDFIEKLTHWLCINVHFPLLNNLLIVIFAEKKFICFYAMLLTMYKHVNSIERVKESFI